MKGAKIILDTDVASRLTAEPQISAGVIIGAVAEDFSYHVVHFAPTLRVDEDGQREDSIPGQSETFDSVTSKALAYHAKQVARMLPGGLDVLGVFAVDDRITAASDPKIKELVSSTARPVFKNWIAETVEDQFPRIFINLNQKTGKMQGKQFSVTKSGVDSKTCEVIVRNLEWVRLETSYDTLAAMHVSKVDASAPLKKNLQVLVGAFSDSLKSAIFLINGQLPSDSNTCGHGTKSVSSNIAVNILLEKEPNILRCETPGDIRSNIEGEMLYHLYVQGKISVLALGPAGSSTSFLARRLKEDIIRSVVSRMQMHCESLIEEESTTEPLHAINVHHEIPRRVFLPVPGSSIMFCDYLFPGDTPKDSLSSFKDILNVELKDDSSIIADKEQPFSFDLQTGEPVEELIMKEGEEINRTIQKFGWARWIGLAVALVIALIATGLGFGSKKLN